MIADVSLIIHGQSFYAIGSVTCKVEDPVICILSLSVTTTIPQFDVGVDAFAVDLKLTTFELDDANALRWSVIRDSVVCRVGQKKNVHINFFVILERSVLPYLPQLQHKSSSTFRLEFDLVETPFDLTNSIAGVSSTKSAKNR
uniref:Uncharacterized protein n=1 Tax=Romanomermis culicivorax TaxID=13658 RepID=A0A915KBN4_ROMCU